MARTSSYGGMLSLLPDWVFNGEFNNLANVLNNRSSTYEAVKNQELQNAQNQIQLDAMQRRAKLNEAFGQQFATDRPASLREAYSQMADTAFSSGDVESGLKLREQVDSIDQAIQQGRMKNLKDSLDAADALSAERIQQLYPGSPLTSADVAAIRAAKQRTRGSGKPDIVKVQDPTTGFIQWMPKNEAIALQANGMIVDPSANEIFMNRLSANLKQKNQQDNQPKGDSPGVVTNLLKWLGTGEQQSQQQQKLVKDIQSEAARYRTFRNKRTGEIVTLPEGQVPK
jgi:hypothetical protein